MNLSVVQTIVTALEKELSKQADASTQEAEKKAQENSAKGTR